MNCRNRQLYIFAQITRNRQLNISVFANHKKQTTEYSTNFIFANRKKQTTEYVSANHKKQTTVHLFANHKKHTKEHIFSCMFLVICEKYSVVCFL